MIDWKKFSIDEEIEQGEYLVTDGAHVDTADLDDCGGDEAMWFLPERRSINSMNEVTHYAEINMPKE